MSLPSLATPLYDAAMPRHVGWTFLFLMVFGGAPRAFAQTTTLDLSTSTPNAADTIAILILSGEEAGVPLSEIYSEARRVLEAHTALTVAALDAISLADRDAAIRDCAGRAGCFASKVRMGVGNIGLLLAVSIDRLDENLLLGLRLVSVDEGRQLGASGDEIPFGMSLGGALETQLADVFPSTIWDQVGSIRIETTPPSAEVSIGPRTCVSPCVLERMKPGTYPVLARKSAHVDWAGEVSLTARQTATLQAILVAEDSGGIWSSPWFWGGVGLIVAGAAAATAVGLSQSGDDGRLVCIAPGPDLCNQQQ